MAGGTGRQVPCRRNKDIRIKAIVDNVDNYSIKNLMVDETGLDEFKVDEMAVDEIAVDEPGAHPVRLILTFSVIVF